MKKYKWLIVLILLLLPGCYLALRFYIYIKPPSNSFPLTLKWRTDLGRSTYERPASQDGLVLFPADSILSSYWYGLNATTGQLIWSQRVPSDSFLRCLSAEYLVVSGPDSLLALKPGTGEIIWEDEIGQTATCSERKVFTIVPRKLVLALDLSTGQTRWAGTAPRESFIGLIYNPEMNELIADGAVIVDPNSGRILRSFDEPSFLGYAPSDQGRGDMYLIDQGQLFIGGSVRDAATGQVFHIEKRFSGFAAPTVSEDTIYIADGSEDGYVEGVAALDRATYAVKWKYQPKHKLPGLSLITLSPVAIFDGIGYVIFDDATLRAFDLETGQEIGYWQPQGLDLLFWPGCTLPIPRLPNPFYCVHSSGVGMAASEDTLFVSFGDGKLYAFGK
jgi:outer membrane protein assembly factor BamB